MTDTKINIYHTSKIYKISSPQTDKFYIGSTTHKLNIRLQSHISQYKRYLEKKYGYTTSYEVVKFNDAVIELIKDVKCENKKELHKIEGEFIKEYHDRILNKFVAGRTLKEWRNVNKEKISENAKEYYEDNKDIFKEKNKEYRKNNKEKIKEQKKKLYDCLCGKTQIQWCSKSQHIKTKFHLDHI
jgi:hypothetical protein